MAEDRRTLVKIAYYYYKQGLTQEQIAQKLLMSRQRVNRLVKRLQDEGIVTIQINGYTDSYIDLESKLENKFHLKQAVVISKMEGENLFDSLGLAGANYLNDVIDYNNIIGVSWGRTLHKIAVYLKSEPKKNISVVQLVGATNVTNAAVQSDEITRVIANKLGGTPHFMYAPTRVKNQETKEALMSEHSIKSSFKMISNCDIVMLSIGEIAEKAPLFEYSYLTEEEHENLKNLGGVGNVCLRYFDINGNLINSPVNSTVMGISIEDLRKIPNIVGIAGGENKVPAILGALRGGYINVLITDNETASWLIEESKS
jgi:deoxyribonucleoside regulator